MVFVVQPPKKLNQLSSKKKSELISKDKSRNSSDSSEFAEANLPIIATDAIDTGDTQLLPEGLEKLLLENDAKRHSAKKNLGVKPREQKLQKPRLKSNAKQTRASSSKKNQSARSQAVADAQDAWQKSQQSESLGVRIGDVSFYMSQPNTCSYLPDRMAASLFAEPGKRFDKDTFTALSELGFRRSGNLVYKPHCNACNACQPIRIPVSQFTPSRSQKRTWKRNQDLTEARLEDIDTNEHYSLYERYINVRHKYGTMYPASRQQYRDFLSTDWPNTFFIEHRDINGVLKSVAVMDELSEGYAAVYTFFDPHDTKRSLGVFSILSQIAQAKRDGYSYLYLGYYIDESMKMNYKADYQPFELLNKGEWRTVDANEEGAPRSDVSKPFLQ